MTIIPVPTAIAIAPDLTTSNIPSKIPIAINTKAKILRRSIAIFI